jgi:hypothetical protein
VGSVFSHFETAEPKALQKGVLPNSDVGVVHFANHETEVFVRLMLPRRCGSMNR